ncbi:MAG: DNA repair protein RecO [Clostridiales bacterium]|nr:DNA repair protein RecO [Clostridiales bacterium]
MHMNTEGLIIRENSTGESDRVVTILTRDYGVLRAFARGAKKTKSSMQSGTQMLCYSKLSLFRGADAYIVDSAEPIEVFFKLRENIERLALAQYFCELAGELSPEYEGSEEQLRLVLNALHFLASGKKPQPMLKAVVELRLMCLAGYMPNLVGCDGCGKFEDKTMFFNPAEGLIFCPDCSGSGIELDMGILTAMRFICYSSGNKLFSFGLPDKSFSKLSEVTEEYLRNRISRKFKTLDFYNTLVQGV